MIYTDVKAKEVVFCTRKNQPMGRVFHGANGVRVNLPDYKLIFTEIIEPSGRVPRGQEERQADREIYNAGCWLQAGNRQVKADREIYNAGCLLPAGNRQVGRYRQTERYTYNPGCLLQASNRHREI